MEDKEGEPSSHLASAGFGKLHLAQAASEEFARGGSRYSSFIDQAEEALQLVLVPWRNSSNCSIEACCFCRVLLHLQPSCLQPI